MNPSGFWACHFWSCASCWPDTIHLSPPQRIEKQPLFSTGAKSPRWFFFVSSPTFSDQSKCSSASIFIIIQYENRTSKVTETKWPTSSRLMQPAWKWNKMKWPSTRKHNRDIFSSHLTYIGQPVTVCPTQLLCQRGTHSSFAFTSSPLQIYWPDPPEQPWLFGARAPAELQNLEKS